jgi:DNA ligase D-like protein (predicted polymerase)
MSPGEGVEWQSVVEIASRLRDLLGNERLNSWPKTTGGKGLHIMVPIEAKLTWNAARDYTREIAERLAATPPGKYTTSAAFSARSGKLFIEYLRNGRAATAIGAYSPRARPGFPVAAPVTWHRQLVASGRLNLRYRRRNQSSMQTRVDPGGGYSRGFRAAIGCVARRCWWCRHR